MPSTTSLDGESTPTNTALNPICPTFPVTTSVVAPSHASTTTATRSRRLPPGAVHWPNLGDSLKCQVKQGLTKAYQSILELQAEGLIHLSMTKSMDAAAIAHIEAHHKDVTASLQAVVADTLSHTNATVDNTIVTLQTEYDAQRRVVFDEINAHKLTTDLALKRTRVAMAKETHRFTSLETCLRRDEMHVLESQHQARIQSLRDEMAAKDAAHVDILLRQKSAFVDIERFSQKLQTALDDALLEVERVKKLDHQRYTNNTAVSTISESYVTSLRHAVAAANEHTEQMRVELEQQTKANETLERVKVALDDSVGRLTHELKTARDLLAESARELISLQEVQATTAKDLAGCRVTIQDLKNRADKLTNELNAQTDLVLTCDDCVADLKTQLESHTKHVERITAEHALAREVWVAETAQLRDSRASDAATIDKLYGKLALLGYDKDMLDMYASPRSVTTSPIPPTGASLPPTGAAPTIHVTTGRPPMTSIVAMGRRCQGVTASRDSNHYDGLVQVLQREQIDLADDKAQRLFDLEASIRASVTSQLTYEFKRTFSKQLRQRMQQERFFLMEKIDSIVAMAAVEERAAKRLLSKQAKAVGRRVSLRGVPETTMTLRKVKATITQAYDAMGVIEWNGEDVAEMKREVAALTKDNADLAAAVADLESKVEIQLLSLAEAELFQKERDMLLVELTKKFNAVTGEVATLKRENKAYDGGDSGSNNQHHVDEATYNMPLSVQGHFPHMDRRPVKSTTSVSTRPQSAAAACCPTPTKSTPPLVSNSVAVKTQRPATSISTKKHPQLPLAHKHQLRPNQDQHSKRPPEHVRSALKWELLGDKHSEGPTKDVVVSSAWVGEAGMKTILDRRRHRK